MSQVSSTKKLLSASALMASGTLISRLLGMLRVVLISFILGNGTRQVDMLSVATTVPNAIYILFAGGALNTVLVPQIVRAIKNDEDGGEAYTNRIMTAFMLIVGVVAIAATAAAPFVTWIYSADRWRTPELADQYASMVALTYLTLPQIFFYGAFFLLAQVLNARDKFGPMMWAPIANNVVSIGVLSIYFFIWGNGGDKSVAFTTPQILLLGLGATAGIATQAAILIPFLRKVGFKFRPRFDLKGTGLGHTFSLTKWTLGFVAVNQLALVIVNRLATTATAGGAGAGMNVYQNAHLLWILPHSLVTTSLATAMLPNASRLAANDDMRGVGEEMTKTMRLALIFIVPATAVFLSLAAPISDFLFGHGKGSADYQWVGWALIAFAVGLIPFTIQFVCLRTFYALENTRTPFLLQIVIAGINAGAAILFVWWVESPTLVATALAAAYSLAYVVAVFLSWNVLKKQLPGISGRAVAMHAFRLSLGAAPAALASYFLAGWIRDLMPGKLGTLLALVVCGLLILGCTVLIGKVLKVREMQNLSTLLRRRKQAKAPATPAAVDGRVDGDDDQIDEIGATRVDGAAVGQEDEESIADSVRRQFTRPANVAPDDPETSLEHVDGPPTEVRPRPALPGQFDPATLIVEGGASRVLPPDEDHSGEIDVDEDSLDEESSPFADSEQWSADASSDPWEADTAIVPSQDPIGERGLVLAARYQLEEPLKVRRDSETWKAHDQVLSRDVVAHVISAGAADSDALLNAARRGAAATDSRFLRVLDVDQLREGNVGVYAICEYSPGQNLEEILRGGPLGKKDGAYIAREVADALSTMHAQGVFHEHLDPEHILITPGGGVRIIGFGVSSALEGEILERPWSEREGSDVVALAQILRATQTGHFDRSLDAAEDRPLSRVWRGAFDGRIGSMSAFVDALPDEDASAELEAKFLLAGRASARRVESVVVEEVVEEDVDEKQAVPARAANLPAPRRRPRVALWLLVLLALVTLIIGLMSVAARDGKSERANPAPNGASSAAGAEQVLPITAVDDFDPEADGGNNEENPDTVENVADGDTETTWQTLRYLRRPNMGGLKPGVGVMLDLGEARDVTGVDVTFVGAGPTTVELYASEDGATRSVEDWSIAATSAAAPAGEHTITPDGKLTTRYLLVYVTELPPVDGGFAAEIAEISVRGS